MDFLKLVNLIAQTIYDKKGFNILALDVKGISTITDYIIIAEGNVERHLKTIANEIIKQLKKIKEKTSYVEGMEEGDWIVLDYLNIIIHLFKPGLREKYSLEKLLEKAKLIDLTIKTEN